jgi:hypothetical protein
MREMDLSAVTYYMGLQLDGWAKSTTFYCPIVAYLDEFKKTSGLLGACGRDIRELDSAITTADQAFQNRKAARGRAVARFKAEGMASTTGEPKRGRLMDCSKKERMLAGRAVQLGCAKSQSSCTLRAEARRIYQQLSRF